MTRPRRFWLPLLAALALFVTTSSVPASAHVARHAQAVASTQALAALLTTHVVFSKPTDASAHVGVVQSTRPITQEQTVLPLLGTQGNWLKVRLPGRPNSHTGWIKAEGTNQQTTGWHIVVHTSTPRVVVYNHGHVVRSFVAIVGAPTTPTPLGEFFVEESVQLAPSDFGAPDALALSARSQVFQHFLGGPGQVAIHGLANIGGTLGTHESHGCIRLATGSVRWLAYHANPGTPVTIIH